MTVTLPDIAKPNVAETWRSRGLGSVNIGHNVRCIGRATLPGPMAFRQDTSYAAWWYEVTCAPQTALVYTDGYYVWWTFTGEVTGGNLDCRYGGVAYTGNQIKRELGKSMRHRLQPYAYSVPVGRSTYHGVTLDIHPSLER